MLNSQPREVYSSIGLDIAFHPFPPEIHVGVSVQLLVETSGAFIFHFKYKGDTLEYGLSMRIEPGTSPEYEENPASSRRSGRRDGNRGLRQIMLIRSLSSQGGESASLRATSERWEIAISGIVQGVGFRPFVYSLARRHVLTGFVRNDAFGVRIEVEGPLARLQTFVRGIESDAPPLADIESVTWKPIGLQGDREFRIEHSTRDEHTARTLVSPDVATCLDCLQEVEDPADRRYRYPFTNCTNCGPRFTITYAVPYDRANTTMSAFTMCPACQLEYDDPGNRRFHAQPNACKVCGPTVRLVHRNGTDALHGERDAVASAATVLRSGAILAVKGLGGYHLACNPFDSAAVQTLRDRKAREDRPFAIMAANLDEVHALVRTSEEEDALLASSARPIVILEVVDRGSSTPVAQGVAPRQSTLGVMLPYTPLHHLLLKDFGGPLVMTSANRSSEPMVFRDQEAFERLGGIADYFLVHDRTIHRPCDDSVMRIIGPRWGDAAGPSPLRRSRGYAPAPLKTNYQFTVATLGCGSHLKNTFCLARERHIFMSPHIGDLDNYETLQSYKEGIAHLSALFDVQPKLIACDLHPDYASTQYANDLAEDGLELISIQHHHAHVASCIVDNNWSPTCEIIGVAFDGTGYGPDSTIWGGEFFQGSIEAGFRRRAHLAYAPLPGGEAAIREPWRAAVAFLATLYPEDTVSSLPLPCVQGSDPSTLRILYKLAKGGRELSGVVPQTSSAGRLFDVVAALLGVNGSRRTTYEGQAAIELELLATGPTASAYPLSLREGEDAWVVETRQLLTDILCDVLAGRPHGEIAARFHRTIANIIVRTCLCIRADGGVNAVALSGGTFQNTLLLRQVVPLLQHEGFSVGLHRRLPANDGGLSIGQAVLAHSMFRQRNGQEKADVSCHTGEN